MKKIYESKPMPGPHNVILLILFLYDKNNLNARLPDVILVFDVICIDYQQQIRNFQSKTK
jgi:hypothetical protein